MLIDERVDIGCIATAIETVGIYGNDRYGRITNFSHDTKEGQRVLDALAEAKLNQVQFLVSGYFDLELLSPLSQEAFLNFGWHREVMPDFEKFRTYVPEPPVPAVEKPLSTKEQNTYLKLIAALCKYCEIDLFSRSAVAELRLRTEEIGLELSNDTLRKIVNALKNILEYRMK
jgi:hypothetical protein